MRRIKKEKRPIKNYIPLILLAAIVFVVILIVGFRRQEKLRLKYQSQYEATLARNKIVTDLNANDPEDETSKE